MATIAAMRVLTSDPPPVEIEALIERRRKLGIDKLDEVWEGVLHMNPAPQRRHGFLMGQLIGVLLGPASTAGLELLDIFNVGEPDNFRIPDAGLVEPGPDAVFLETAALVVEVVSPGDETWDKVPFYAAHDVNELLIVDPKTCKIDWFGLVDGQYTPIERSSLIDLGPKQLSQLIDWPPRD